MIIQVDTPTIDVEEEEVDDLYDQVQFEFDKTCKQAVRLIIGDRMPNM